MNTNTIASMLSIWRMCVGYDTKKSCSGWNLFAKNHYNDVIMVKSASLITSLTIVNSTVYSSADQRKLLSPTSLAFVWGIHRSPVNSPHKRPVTRIMLPFGDVITIARQMAWNKTLSSISFMIPSDLYLEPLYGGTAYLHGVVLAITKPAMPCGPF